MCYYLYTRLTPVGGTFSATPRNPRRSMAAAGAPKDFTRPDEVAVYVAALARELMTLTHRHALVLLSYLLDMVCLEAEQRSHPKAD